MFQPKKTIPKLVLGTLALSGCGDPVVPGTGQQRPCLTEKTVAGLGNYYGYGGNYYGGGDYGDYGNYDFNGNGDSYGPSYAAGCSNGGGNYAGGSYGGGGDFVLPDPDPNPTNDPFLPGGDFYGYD